MQGEESSTEDSAVQHILMSCDIIRGRGKYIKGVEKKTYTFENHSDETVFSAKNILEGCFIKKVGSLALSGVQKHFCMISGS